MEERKTITIPMTMDAEEFWSEIMGSTEFYEEWWAAVKFKDGAQWDKPGKVDITVYTDVDSSTETVTKTLDIDDLAKAYGEVIAKPYYHCGGTVDIHNMDSCASDIVLQQAMFGDVIYG